MTAALIKILKKLLLTMFSEKILEWLLFWVAKMLVESTKTTKDDEFYQKIKEAYYGESNGSETR